MKTYNQFISETKQLDEGIGTIAKVAIKGAAKFAKKGGLKKIGKKLFKKAPKRSIDPYFANKAVERGTMVRGFHGQSAKNIAKYKKSGVPAAVSGVNTDVMKQYKNNPATLDWIKKSGWKPKGNQARSGIDAYFSRTREVAGNYAKRGANYENQKLKNVLNPFKKKDKGGVMPVVVNKRSVRDSWKGNTADDAVKYASEKIAKAKDIIPVVPGPSSKIAKYRLMKLKRTKHQRINSQ